ncbi:HIT domain-containing protein [Candidatus Woesearchaeota archaeon]|nr:HIT domain-containing protein [Candidatus Woesearchaeota archaeon]
MTDNPPEQTEDLQRQQCIFCHIVSGKISSRKVYEDEKCLAILDINPANPGHVLILPKEHHPIMPMMHDSEVAHLFKIARRISKAQIRGLNADGTNIFIANGAAAGQKAPHFMIHVIPRKEKDGITCFTLPKNKIAADDQDKLRKAIKLKVTEHLGGGIEREEEHSEEPEKVEATVEPEAPEEEPQDTEKQEPEEAEGSEEEMMEIPPPEHYEHEQDDEEKEERPNKGLDLDKISKLFG